MTKVNLPSRINPDTRDAILRKMPARGDWLPAADLHAELLREETDDDSPATTINTLICEGVLREEEGGLTRALAPERKVIQVLTAKDTNGELSLVTLCDDGTLWMGVPTGEGWGRYDWNRIDMPHVMIPPAL